MSEGAGLAGWQAGMSQRDRRGGALGSGLGGHICLAGSQPWGLEEHLSRPQFPHQGEGPHPCLLAVRLVTSRVHRRVACTVLTRVVSASRFRASQTGAHGGRWGVPLARRWLPSRNRLRFARLTHPWLSVLRGRLPHSHCSSGLSPSPEGGERVDCRERSRLAWQIRGHRFI